MKTSLAQAFKALDSCTVRLSRKMGKTEGWQPDFTGKLFTESGTLSLQAWLLPSSVVGQFEALSIKFSLSPPNNPKIERFHETDH